ncbi:type V secretory pathway, adhesin AidA [Stutzerimonas stutzeri]|jgi:hypothetical protein|nr:MULTISPECIES: DUF1302 domain-containing protein [Stutzerimonas stutzeri group]KKJ94883.1 type V secretory pathway, adhesin AidA [Stutzerimonas stutzeri]MAF88555.1 DUF1302 domain-containing protein [Pseudomonas sp.]MBD3877129.1 DUF1302 domain-containing protein [Stutzerimonas kunmingensis]QIJ01998.1 DUF1302 family protein [Stutzerimonas balearica]HCH76484.1 DUF1302 domain-containing protein [Pseudomonas sp.]|tara:strand:+ start:12551 stop:14422 length:1872 start_codon:yes stop_codon:yes gene_type:complete
MTKTTRQGFFQPKTLALAVALGTAAPAYAVNFNIGELEGQFDSSMSVGASWSMADRDMDLVGLANGGTGYTQTGDDGRLNFKKGETFSKIFKGVHDLELRYRDSGAFIRGKYWYDFELKDENRLFKDISDSNRKEAAQSSGAQILDAFLYHNYAIGDLPGTVRLGKQVVSWGESTFIGNSINSINPLDAAAFRRPGAEIKEGLIPVNMLYVSQSLTDRLSMEAFYQLEWDQTIIDNCGTFYASNDVAADGCDDNYTVLSAAQRDAIIGAGVTIDQLNALIGADYYAGLDDLGIIVGPEGVTVPRGGDRDARDSGQYGFAFRWLGDVAEYGLYFMNYHSRTPTVGYQNASAAEIQALLGLLGTPSPGGPLPSGAAFSGLASAALLSNGEYYLEYPEDIRLYGASFSTTLPTGTAWSGEISYRPNLPVALNSTYTTGLLATGIGGSIATGDFAGAIGQAGIEHRGYNRKEVTQLQTTFTHFFDQVLGAQRVTVVGEIGYAHVGGLESKSELRYGRDSIYGLDTPEYGNDGFVTANSWGYRLRAIADYDNVFAGINFKPNLSFSHDVDGYGPNGLFNEGSKAVSIGLDAEYQNMYTASLSYTDFFGGDYNTLVDRDFLAFSVGVNF